MTDAERERTGGLSQDLYTVSDPTPTKLEPMTPDAQADLGAVYEARERGDWDSALVLLRKIEKTVQISEVANLRGHIWEEIGEKQVAAVFYEHANRLEPGN